MVIPENNIISLSDNIPLIPPVEGLLVKEWKIHFLILIKPMVELTLCKEGTPIISASSGVVVFSGWTYEMGN